MGFFARLQARKELSRIEDRYVKRSNRNVWRSDAQYVDGEYIYTCRQDVQAPPSRSAQHPSDSSIRGSSSRSRPSTHSSTASGSSKSSSSSSHSSSASSGRQGGRIAWGLR